MFIIYNTNSGRSDNYIAAHLGRGQYAIWLIMNGIVEPVIFRQHGVNINTPPSLAFIAFYG